MLQSKESRILLGAIVALFASLLLVVHTVTVQQQQIDSLSRILRSANIESIVAHGGSHKTSVFSTTPYTALDYPGCGLVCRFIVTPTVGPPGANGTQGEKGDLGERGPMGLPGPTGPTGAIGPQGSTGAVGQTGSLGPQGPIGLQGAVGPQGPVGPSGSNAVVPTVNYTLNGTLTAATVLATKRLNLPIYNRTTKASLSSVSAGTVVYDTSFSVPSTFDGRSWRSLRIEVGEVLVTSVFQTTSFVTNPTQELLQSSLNTFSTSSTDIFSVIAGRLNYIGTYNTTGFVSLSMSVSMFITNNGATKINNFWRFGLYKNGVAIPGSYLQNIYDTNDYQIVSFNKYISLSPNDSLSVYATASSAYQGLNINQLSLQCSVI